MAIHSFFAPFNGGGADKGWKKKKGTPIDLLTPSSHEVLFARCLR
jgi:hypothetical protein